MLYALGFLVTILFKLTLYTILTFIGLIFAFITYVKIRYEPVKGVCTCTNKLTGKVVLLTGGNSGLGLETARGLARRSARVIIASRDQKKSQQAIQDIIRTTGNNNIEYRPLDLSSFKNIREFADEFNKTVPRLDILVNNSGCVGLKPRITEDGIDIVTQVNYFGAFLLTNLLLPKLEASKPSRIILVSSLAHRFCTFDPDDIAALKFKNSDIYSTWTIYARSKLLQILWARGLAKRLSIGVTVNALHPGVIRTDIFNRLPAVWQSIIEFITGLLFKNTVEGAQTALHLCLAPELEHASGGYYADCTLSTPRSLVCDDRLVEKIWHDSLLLTKS